MGNNKNAWRFGEEELQYVKEVLDSGLAGSTDGTMNSRLQEAFAARFGVGYGITHSNGTATMHSCLAAVGIGPGDEVIIPAFGVAATGTAVIHANAVPVFADVDPDTFTIDPADVAAKITPRTKAIIPVHLYGLPCDMDPIMELAKKHDLYVIEDSAQCFLAEYKGRLAGTIGHMASFSFECTKHITTGDGGIVLTDDRDLAVKIRKFACHGYRLITSESQRVRTQTFAFMDRHFKRIDTLGWNYRLPEVAAAVGLAQVERLDSYVALRRRIDRLYREAIGDWPYLKPQHVPEGSVSACWTLAARYEGEQELGVTWEAFGEKFCELGGDGVYAAWSPMYLEPVFVHEAFYGKGCPTRCPLYEGEVNWQEGMCPNSESIQTKIMQFKGNMGDETEIQQQVEALHKTVEFFK